MQRKQTRQIGGHAGVSQAITNIGRHEDAREVHPVKVGRVPLFIVIVFRLCL